MAKQSITIRVRRRRNLLFGTSTPPIVSGIGAVVASGTAPKKLVFVTLPPSSAINDVPFSVQPSVQIQTAEGVNVPDALVLIVPTADGPAAQITSTAVRTNSSGFAQLQNVKITGLVGAYQFYAIATGYTETPKVNLTLTVGAPVASNTTAQVPNGTPGLPTQITVTVKDISGNLVTSAAGVTLFAQISGANSASISSWTFLGAGQFRGTYTPSVGGTDSVAITLNGTGISASPYSSVVSGTLAGALRSGPYGAMDDRLGQGPGDDTGPPIWRFAGFNPHVVSAAQVTSIIAQADLMDIQLLAVMPGTTPEFGSNSATGFDFGAYKAKLDYLLTIPGFNDAVARGRIYCYIGDEPYHAKWENSSGVATWTPVIVNECARETKRRWPAGYTFLRCDTKRLRNGWGGFPKPTSYDALDYAWLQYDGPHGRSGLTPEGALVAERLDGDFLNIGVAFSLNLWAGGIHVDQGGVPACWDYLNNGSSYGVVIGAGGVGSHPELVRGDTLTCAQWNALTGTRPTVIASPAWIRYMADHIYADANLPFLSYWAIPGDVANFAVPYWDRPDFVSALDYATTKALSRPSWNGLRQRKVYP